MSASSAGDPPGSISTLVSRLSVSGTTANTSSNTTTSSAPVSVSPSAMSSKKPKKKKAVVCGGDDGNGAAIPSPSPSLSPTSSAHAKKDSGSGSLIICRNKHWRYISSFHGPWLQLPPEVLESLAYHNWGTPRPHPIDPAAFFDIVKIRRLVDEATTISVRAASGMASSSNSSYNSSATSLMGGGNAAILGIGFGNPNSTAKLSRERKHRMRELATQKLCKAYALDEIAASVATMQGASALEDVASFVLQKAPDDADAKYVHFFHEKIPSRMLAASTSLEPLDQVILQRPYDGWVLRTRAVTKGFKDDYSGAALDLTAALKKVRNAAEGHVDTTGTVLINELFGGNSASIHASMNIHGGTGNGSGGGPGPKGADSTWDGESKDEAEQPASLEMQLLFHRACTYLTIACQRIDSFTTMFDVKHHHRDTNGNSVNREVNGNGPATATADLQKREQMRKAIRANAKKAIRDYLKFLSHFDYSPGLPAEEIEAQMKSSSSTKKIEYHESSSANSQDNQNGNVRSHALPPRGPLYPVSTLFTSPPSGLPPYPPRLSTEITKFNAPDPESLEPVPVVSAAEFESVTYHPLLTDALHSLLLCYAIISSPAKELQRHAYMVARIARICDGYPIFLAARSPARADWIELMRKIGDAGWIGLGQSWESLCQPAPLTQIPWDASEEERTASFNHGGYTYGPDGPNRASSIEVTHGYASAPVPKSVATPTADSDISSSALSALMAGAEDKGKHGTGNTRILTKETMRLMAKRQQQRDEYHQETKSSRRWAQEDGKEYPISTERAAVIARFVREEIRRDKEGKSGGAKGGGMRKKSGGVGDIVKEVSVISTASKESGEEVD